MSTQTATRKPTEIQQAVVHRCTCKETQEVFYVIRSDSDHNTWYEIHWDEQCHGWHCGCKSTRPCKHERAVTQVLAAKQALKREAEPAQVVHEVEQDECDIECDKPEAYLAQEPEAYLAHEPTPEVTQIGAQVVAQEVERAEKFLALYQRYDHRSAPAKVEPKPEKYVPIAERGSLNGSKAFSLLR